MWAANPKDAPLDYFLNTGVIDMNINTIKRFAFLALALPSVVSATPISVEIVDVGYGIEISIQETSEAYILTIRHSQDMALLSVEAVPIAGTYRANSLSIFFLGDPFEELEAYVPLPGFIHVPPAPSGGRTSVGLMVSQWHDHQNNRIQRTIIYAKDKRSELYALVQDGLCILQ